MERCGEGTSGEWMWRKARRTTLRAVAVALAVVASQLLAMPRITGATQVTVTPPRYESGTYDVWEHGPSDDPLLVKTGRVVELHVRKQTLQTTTYVDGRPRVSRILVPDGPIQFDGKMARWYQDFETAPNDPKAIHERIRVLFRNDALGAYDVQYRLRDNSWTTEVLVKRPQAAD
jgi:hypothetical protein